MTWLRVDSLTVSEAAAWLDDIGHHDAASWLVSATAAACPAGCPLAAHTYRERLALLDEIKRLRYTLSEQSSGGDGERGESNEDRPP